MQKRHPRPPIEDLLTKRSEIVELALFLRTDPDFCLSVVKTVDTIRHNEGIAAEFRRREALPAWRKKLHKLWLRFR